MARGPADDHGLLQTVEDAVIQYQPAAVIRENAQVVGIRHLVAGEEALLDLEVATASTDRVDPLDEPRLRVLDNRHAEDLQALDRDVAGLDLHSVRDAAERIGSAVP